MSNQLSVDRACKDVVREVGARLTASGYRVQQSFDLQAARRSLRKPDVCTCPHHGTAMCTCQYVILLVSKQGGGPVTLVAHGHGGRTHLSFSAFEQPSAAEAQARLLAEIRQVALSLYGAEFDHT